MGQDGMKEIIEPLALLVGGNLHRYFNFQILALIASEPIGMPPAQVLVLDIIGEEPVPERLQLDHAKNNIHDNWIMSEYQVNNSEQ